MARLRGLFDPRIPAAALGARTLLGLPSHAVDIAIGIFLILMGCRCRHWLARHQLKASSGILRSRRADRLYHGHRGLTGPLSVPPVFVLRPPKGAFLATEAASSLGLYLSKSVTFERFGALTPDVAVKGLVAGASLMSAPSSQAVCAQAGAGCVPLVMDAIMLVAGASLLWAAATS